MRYNSIIFILILSFASCSQSAKDSSVTSFTGNAMTIDYAILMGHSLTNEEKQHIQGIIFSTFEEVDQIYNKYNPHSELSQLNRLGAHDKKTLSPQLYSLFQLTDQIVSLSKGKFDPTVEPLQQLWKNKLEKHGIPSPEEVQRTASSVGWHKIHFQDGLFSKDNPDIHLDLGGIAKGLCVDLLVERISQEGYRDLFVDWGGEIRASGNHPEGRPWRIFISYPNNPDPSKAITVLDLENKSIATSGDYLQYWTYETTTYFHIIDPHTYTPLTSKPGKVTSASVLAPTCAFADGLATVAMMFESAEEAQEWAEDIQKQFPVCFWLVTRE